MKDRALPGALSLAASLRLVCCSGASITLPRLVIPSMLALSQLVPESVVGSIGRLVGALEAAEVLQLKCRRRRVFLALCAGLEGCGPPPPGTGRRPLSGVWLVFTGLLPSEGSWWFR
ncbi:hypothetical protein Slala04_66310 [Streptomyces lavendulae subsp. lavendulae]|nr:hypothetical protein Slala04_66310 [Streptomyces lavendulae subsp. lavendulae]